MEDHEALGAVAAAYKLRRRSPSRSQAAYLVLIAVLSLGLEGLIVFTILQGRATAATYQQRGNAATAVQRTERELLRLQVDAEHWLNSDSPDLRALDTQRAVLTTQWRILLLEVADDPATASSVGGLESDLAGYDALIDEVRTDSSAEHLNTVAERSNVILREIERRLKVIYDREENAFFGAMSAALAAQQQTQLLLLGISALVLATGIAFAAAVWRTVRANMARAYGLVAEGQARLELALDAAHMATWDWDLGADRLTWSGRTDLLFGVSADAFGQTVAALLELVHPADRTELAAALRQAAADGGEHEHEFRVLWPDGSMRWIAARSRVDRDPTGQAGRASGVYLDISVRKAAELELVRLAFTDVLTGLPNRAALLGRLESALVQADAAGRPLGLLFLDLDNFKVINDTLGHLEGDRLLTAVAELLRTCLPEHSLAARLGGDEFTVLLDGPEAVADAPEVGRRITEMLRGPISLGGRSVFVTASVGVAQSVPGRDAPESLLRRADLALYRAKAEGKARVAFFDPSLGGARGLGWTWRRSCVRRSSMVSCVSGISRLSRLSTARS